MAWWGRTADAEAAARSPVRYLSAVLNYKDFEVRRVCLNVRVSNAIYCEMYFLSTPGDPPSERDAHILGTCRGAPSSRHPPQSCPDD
jgi:hypothetical protein